MKPTLSLRAAQEKPTTRFLSVVPVASEIDDLERELRDARHASVCAALLGNRDLAWELEAAIEREDVSYVVRLPRHFRMS